MVERRAGFRNIGWFPCQFDKVVLVEPSGDGVASTGNLSGQIFSASDRSIEKGLAL